MDGRDREPDPTVTEESSPNIQDNQNCNLDSEEKLQKKKKRQEIKENQRKTLVKSGKVFIVGFKNLLVETKACNKVARQYFERVLHSIFFFGHINDSPISPDEFVPKKYIEQFKKIAPKAFSEYNTHVPYYTPYSILLEYMTEHLKPEDPDLFMEKLAAVNASLWKVYGKEEDETTVNEFALTASVVSYSCIKDSNSDTVLKKTYGASLSCKGRTQRTIMIDISTLHVWDRAISYAVCCEGKSPPITFPKQVYCYAYRYVAKEGKYKKIPPCTKCNKMYVVSFHPEHEEHDNAEDWPYGNCAENESLNRLLQSDKDVRKNICIADNNGEKLSNKEEIENMFKNNYEHQRKKRVKQLLTSRKFKFSPETKFFTPS